MSGIYIFSPRNPHAPRTDMNTRERDDAFFKMDLVRRSEGMNSVRKKPALRVIDFRAGQERRAMCWDDAFLFGPGSLTGDGQQDTTGR